MTNKAAVNYNIKSMLGSLVTAMLSNLGYGCGLEPKLG